MGLCDIKMNTALMAMILSVLNVHDNNLFKWGKELHSEHIIADFVLALAIETCQSLWVMLNNFVLFQ